MRSIRSRLLLGLLGSMLIAQMLIYAMVYARIEDEIDDLFDGELERSAFALSSGAGILPVAPRQRKVVNPQEGMVVAVWEGPLMRVQPRSARLPGVSPATPLGFSKLTIGRRRWRLFAARSGGRFIVVAQPADVRGSAARQISLRLLLPSLAVVPIAGLMIWLAVSFGLRPLMRITAELCSRSHRDLSPIGSQRLPTDIAPVVHALNDLMLRVGQVIAAQRSFIADAAHELLTPLTALRLQAHLLARADSPGRQREVLSELQGGVSRTLQLARQLLTLARHGADAADRSMAEVDLEQIVRKVVAIHQPLAEARSIRTQVIAASSCVITGHEEALGTMVSSLVENAIKYTDSDGAVRVRLEAGAGRIVLEVEDSGPGIPPEERERVFDRFYRRPGNTASGSGLGLAIAREIATRHGATITLHTSDCLGGLAVRVELDMNGKAGHLDSSLSRVA